MAHVVHPDTTSWCQTHIHQCQEDDKPSCKEFWLVFFVRAIAGCDGCVSTTHAQVQQDIGKPRHIGDRRKALDKTSQTITSN